MEVLLACAGKVGPFHMLHNVATKWKVEALCSRTNIIATMFEMVGIGVTPAFKRHGSLQARVLWSLWDPDGRSESVECGFCLDAQCVLSPHMMIVVIFGHGEADFAARRHFQQY